ncbi:hypothetical protein EV182_000554, partial [Spiromyces aspiralis]
MYCLENLPFELKCEVAKHLTKINDDAETLRNLAACSESWARVAWPFLWQEALDWHNLIVDEACPWASFDDLLRYGRKHVREITLSHATRSRVERLLRTRPPSLRTLKYRMEDNDMSPDELKQLFEANRHSVCELIVLMTEYYKYEPSFFTPPTVESLAQVGFTNLRRLEFEKCDIKQFSGILGRFPQIEELKLTYLCLDNLDDLLAGDVSQEQPACRLRSFSCGLLQIQNWPEPSGAVEVVRPSSPGLHALLFAMLREASICYRRRVVHEHIRTSIRLFCALAFSGPMLDLTCLSVPDLYQGEAQLVVANAPNLTRLELSYFIYKGVESSIEGAVQTVLANLRHLKYFVLFAGPSEYTPYFSPEALVAPSSSGTTPGDLLRPNFACQGLKLFKALSYTFDSSDALLPFAHLPELETLVISYRHTKLESLQSVLRSDSLSGAPLKTFPRLENLVISRDVKSGYYCLLRAYIDPGEYKKFAPLLALFPALRRCTADIYFAKTDSALHKEFPNIEFNFSRFN